VPGKGGAARRRRPRRPARYRRVAPGEVLAATARLAAHGALAFDSQAALRRAVLGEVRADEPTSALGGRRLRRLLIDAAAVRIAIRYAPRPDDERPVTACPVCGDAVRPIRNRTIDGDRIVLGYTCRRCPYWTHRPRRVPVRYELRLRPGGRGVTAPRSA